MIDKMSKDDCVGCGLCASVCDRQAITMQPDECTGFFYPFIDESKCTECKKCQISCPVVVKRKSCKLKTQRTNSPKCFAVRSLNDETRFASTSGGFFTEIATEILDNGGKVYGVGYSDGMDVLHMRIDNTADLKVLQKSKYVQSDMRDVYVDIKKDIESGDLVLFVGCP